jgi:hypothetical protein
MASFNKFNQFVADVASGVHQMQTGTSQVFKVMLTNTAPTAANAVKADITELGAGNGYPSGGVSVGTITGSQSGGTFKFVGGTDPVITATGAVGPFRYVVLYGDTPTSPAKPLIGWWDYGSAVTLASGETFTVDLDQTNGILTLA